MIRTIRKKPKTLQAIQWDGTSECLVEIQEFMDGRDLRVLVSGREGWQDKVVIPTLEGDMLASVGDWIIRGVAGEFYPCKPDIFDQLYDVEPYEE